MSQGKRFFVVIVGVAVLAAVLVIPRFFTRDISARVSIGGKQFTEQEILGQLMSLLVEHHTDLKVERTLNLGGTMICFNALKAGDLDLYAEYTGTGLVNILNESGISDPDRAYKKVKETFSEKYSLTWLKPFGFNNTYTLTMRRDRAEELGLETISDLAQYVKDGKDAEDKLQAAFDAEFHTRPDGYKGLCRHYGFTFPSKPRQMDPGLMYKAVSDGAVDIIDGFATDGRIAAYDLVVLEDDKNFFPPYYAAPLVRADTLKKYPELGDALNALAGRLPDATMQKLNFEVDEKGRKAADVAEKFLVSNGLIKEKNPSD